MSRKTRIRLIVTMIYSAYVLGCNRSTFKTSDDVHDEILETHKIGSTGDTSLQLVTRVGKGQRQPAPLHWQVQNGSRQMRLESLWQLQGLVTITCAEDALKILRILSDHPYALKGPLREVEVKPDDHCQFESERGLPNHIPSAIYEKSGLKPVAFKTEPDAFVITRLMYMQDMTRDTERVVEVQEIMGRDGTYVRKILSSKPPPPIPDIKWMIPGRK